MAGDTALFDDGLDLRYVAGWCVAGGESAVGEPVAVGAATEDSSDDGSPETSSDTVMRWPPRRPAAARG